MKKLKKLVLKKETIVDLTNQEMKEVKGGMMACTDIAQNIFSCQAMSVTAPCDGGETNRCGYAMPGPLSEKCMASRVGC